MKKRKIIIDCDPGIDDSFAICIAIKDECLEVLGIHTVSGNVSVDYTTRNARGIVHLLNEEVEIFKGNRTPLISEPIFAADIHGNNGLAGYQFPEDALAPVSDYTSLQGYLKLLEESEEKVTIVAVGPLTNVAVLLKAYPHLKEKIECISLMGGGIKGGNITGTGEFNFYVDPHSAHIVFNSGVPIVMAGLDVTEKARITREDIQIIREKGGEIGRFLYEIAQASFVRNQSQGFGDSIAPNDAVSILYLTHPELFIAHDMHIQISTQSGLTRGMSTADVRRYSDKKPNAKVIMDVDEEGFRKILVKKIIGGDYEKDTAYNRL